MKTNKNAFRISSIILSLIMIIVAIPTFGVLAEDSVTETTEAPEYYFWDKVEYIFENNSPFLSEGEDGSIVASRPTLGGVDFGLKCEDGSMFTLSPDTSYRLSFKYKVTALTDEANQYICFYPGRYATERGDQGNYSSVVGRAIPLDGTIAETAAFLKNEAVRITEVMDEYETYTINFKTNSLKRTVSGVEYLYDDFLLFTYGVGAIAYDDFEIAEITDEQIATENYDKATTYYTQNNSTYVDGGMSTTYATSIYENGVLTGTGKGGTQVRFNNPSNAAILGFYFDGEYQLEPSTTYTLRFRAYANEVYTTEENSLSTEGVYIFPAVGHKPNSANKINRTTTLYAAHSANTVWYYNSDNNAKSQRPFICEEKVLKTYEHTFTTPATFNEDATDGTCNYFMLALLGRGYDLYIDRIEIAKVTSATTYYPNLNGSEYTNTPNYKGVTVKRSLVMNDAVVKPLELSGCGTADMSNFKFVGWYSDAALETSAVNDTVACYAAWDVAEDYTITRDFATTPYEYKTDLSCDVSSATGSNMSNDSGKLKFETAADEEAERYYVIRDNGYKNFKLYSDSVYKIELCYGLMENSEITLGWAARSHDNLGTAPTTLLSTVDGEYTLTDSSPASGKLVYYISTAKFSHSSNSKVGQYFDSLSLTVKGTGSISFSSISVTALAAEPITNEFTFAGENVTYVVPNRPGIATRYALTLAGDGSSISVHTGSSWQVDALGLTVNNKVLYDTSDTAGKVYNTALHNGDKIAINGFNKGNCVNAANFAVVAAQTVDYPDTDTDIRFRIRSYNYNNGNSDTVAYNSKEYTVVRYGIKVGESYVKDDIDKANALKAEGTDISLEGKNAYNSTDRFTDYTLAVKDVDEERYIYAVGYMVLDDINNPGNNITVYSKNVLVNSYNDLQNGTLGSIITVSQK